MNFVMFLNSFKINHKKKNINIKNKVLKFKELKQFNIVRF